MESDRKTISFSELGLEKATKAEEAPMQERIENSGSVQPIVEVQVQSPETTLAVQEQIGEQESVQQNEVFAAQAEDATEILQLEVAVPEIVLSEIETISLHGVVSEAQSSPTDSNLHKLSKQLHNVA